MHWGWHGWLMGWIWIIWIIIVVIVVWFIARGGAGVPIQRRETPEEILKRRYASGEINREDYEQMLNDIRR